MNISIPDGAAWASLPIIATFLAWNGKQFVSYCNKKPDNVSTTTTTVTNPPQSQTISLADFTQISSAVERVFNGRYMLAEEARNKFAALDSKISEESHKTRCEFHSAIAELKHQPE